LTFRALSLLVFTLALSTLSSACGDDGGEADFVPATAPPVTKAEFVKRANAICKKQRAGLMREVSSYERSHISDKPSSYIDAVHWVFLPAIDEEIMQLEELEKPPKDEKRIEKMIYAQKAALDSVAVIPEVASVRVAERSFLKPGRQLRVYGLSSCTLGL
jgi:hypothetical protein